MENDNHDYDLKSESWDLKLDALVRLWDEEKVIKFNIVEQKTHGFLVRIDGFFAYISNHYMPWKYQNHNYWKLIGNYLLDEEFEAKVYKVDRNPLSILLQGVDLHIDKSKLIQNSTYYGIILTKNYQSLIIDFGYHFSWKYGAVLCTISKKYFVDQVFQSFSSGQLVEFTYFGLDENGDFIFGNKPVMALLNTNIRDSLLNEIVKVAKIKNGEFSFLVDGQFPGKLVLGNKSTLSYLQVLSAVNKLNEGDLINGKIIKISNRLDHLVFSWDDEEEIKRVLQMDKILTKSPKVKLVEDKQLLAKKVPLKDRISAGDMVDVFVRYHFNINNTLEIRFLIENEISCDFIVVNKSRKITNSERRKIMSNFQNGEVLNCRITHKSANSVIALWEISDIELISFLEECVQSKDDVTDLGN